MEFHGWEGGIKTSTHPYRSLTLDAHDTKSKEIK